MIAELDNPIAAKVAALEAVLKTFSDAKIDFPASLITQFKVKGYLSEKQLLWVEKLTAEANEKLAAKTAPQTPVASLGDVHAAFAKVTKPGAARPRVFLATITSDEDTAVVTLEPAKPGSVNFGHLYVYWRAGSAAKKGHYIAKISSLGVPLMTGVPATANYDREAVKATIRAFCSDPLDAIKAAGKATGACCNCGKHLTHPASVTLGVGSTCVGYLGLQAEWNALAKQFKAETKGGN